MADVTPPTDTTPVAGTPKRPPAATASGPAGKAPAGKQAVAPRRTPVRPATTRRPTTARRPVPSIAPPEAVATAIPDVPEDTGAKRLAPVRDVGPVSRYQASVAKAQVEFVLEVSRIQLALARDVARATSPAKR